MKHHCHSHKTVIVPTHQQGSEGGSIQSPSGLAPLAGEEGSPEEESEDGVSRRNKNQGMGADMLKEIRVKQEKRASVIPLPR